MSDQMVRRPEVHGLSHNWEQMSYASGLPAQRKVMQVRAWYRAPGYGDLGREGTGPPRRPCLLWSQKIWGESSRMYKSGVSAVDLRESNSLLCM